METPSLVVKVATSIKPVISSLMNKLLLALKLTITFSPDPILVIVTGGKASAEPVKI